MGRLGPIGGADPRATEAILISIRRHIDESEQVSTRFYALLKTFQDVVAVLHKTVLPPNPVFSQHCRESLERITAPLDGSPTVEAIDEAGKSAVEQVEEICRSNKSMLEEIDITMKDVVATVAIAISGFRGHGERHSSSLAKMADGFEALARVEDVTELRRRLRGEVAKLRESVEEMRRESHESARDFELQITSFRQRLEKARQGSDIDRLTLLGSRRVAERHLQALPRQTRPVCVLLFDIEGFREINHRLGTPFGDRLLQALADALRENFPEQDVLFRWGSDEFLAIAEGSPTNCATLCRAICASFAAGCCAGQARGGSEPPAAKVAWGAAQYTRGEKVEELYRRSRANLEQNRRSLRG
jgi:diguanylate cyclase (GGDEF)-like protein